MITAPDELKHIADLFGAEEVLRRVEAHAALVEACRDSRIVGYATTADALEQLAKEIDVPSPVSLVRWTGFLRRKAEDFRAALAAAGDTSGEAQP